MELLDSISGERRPAPAFSIHSCVEMLHQNKRVVRDEGLKDLVATLEGFVSLDEIDSYMYAQAMDRCHAFLISGSAREKKDAYRAIGLYALTAGPKDKEVLDRLFELDRLAGMLPTSTSPSEVERAVAAIDCLAAATFACAKRPAGAKRSLKAIWEVVEQAAVPQVLAAALSAWTVVLPAARDMWTSMVPPFVVIARLLRAGEPAVWMAAGEALAVCVELNILPHQPPPPPTYYYYYRAPEPKPNPEDRPSLESRAYELGFGANTHRKEDAEERALFRQIYEFLRDPLRPRSEETWSAGGCGVVKVSKWAKLVQLNFLRQYLGDGFPAHFQLNQPLFGDSFGLIRTAADGEDLTLEEKKHRKQSRDKQRNRDRTRDRREKMKQYI